jgi:hypothetical protein
MMACKLVKKETPVETGVDKPKPTAYEKIVRIFLANADLLCCRFDFYFLW